MEDSKFPENNLSTMSNQTLISQEQKPSMNYSLCTLHNEKNLIAPLG